MTTKGCLSSLKLYVAAFGIIIGAPFQFGYGNGVMNSMAGPLQQVYNSTGVSIGDYSWNTALSLTTGLWCAGGGVGALVGGPSASYFGRKITLLFNNVFLMLGAFLQTVPLQSDNYYDFVLWGRFVNGVGCGIATTVGPMMLTEISPIHLRGIFGTCNQFGVVVGMLIAWIVGMPELAIEGELNSSAFVLGLPLVFGLIQLLILPWCYDSPAFLISKDKSKAIKAAIFYQLEPLKTDENDHGEKSSNPDPISSPLFYRPLIIAIVMMLSQQLSGINAIFFYSTNIFANAGVSNGALSTVYVGIVNVVFTFISLVLIEKFGRKTLHLLGLSGMMLMAIGLGTLLGFYLDSGNEVVSVLAVVFVLVFVAFFQCGPGSIPWFISAELFDEINRPRAMSIAAFVNWSANACIGFSYPLLDEAIGGKTFFIFAGLLLIFSIYTFSFVPETKGKSIREIQGFFGDDGLLDSGEGIENRSSRYEKDSSETVSSEL